MLLRLLDPLLLNALGLAKAISRAILFFFFFKACSLPMLLLLLLLLLLCLCVSTDRPKKKYYTFGLNAWNLLRDAVTQSTHWLNWIEITTQIGFYRLASLITCLPYFQLDFSQRRKMLEFNLNERTNQKKNIPNEQTYLYSLWLWKIK